MARQRKPRADLSQKGLTGLPVYAGRVYDEILTELQGERGRRVLREMSEQDPIVGGVLFGIEMLARQVPWSMTPANETDKAKKVADFVDGALSDLSPTFGSTLSEILSMLPYGWSWLEIVYKKREGLKPEDQLHSSRFSDSKIGWGGWAIRSQETLWRWEYENPDDTGQLKAMIQSGPPDWKERRIPRSKSLHFTTRSRRENPEGISILRNAYRAWYMKKNIEIIEGIGVERDLAGLPVMGVPPNLLAQDASDEEKALLAILQKIVTSIKRDEQEGIIMPLEYDEDGKNPVYKLELLSAGGERQFDTNGIINRYDERIAMSMLADFILMGHQAVGSFALSTTKTGLFSTALSAIMDVVADEINQNAIPKLVLLNGWSLDLVPTLQHGKIEASDLDKLGQFLKQLSDAGMVIFPNIALEKHLLDLAGLPMDPGATRLPLPIDPETGQPIQPEPGQLQPPNQPQLPAGRPATSAQLPAGASATKAAKPTTSQRRVASEPKRHFVPLAVRVSKLEANLREAMSEDEYRAFLAAVMEHGKFSKLPEQYQEFIIQAEQAS